MAKKPVAKPARRTVQLAQGPAERKRILGAGFKRDAASESGRKAGPRKAPGRSGGEDLDEGPTLSDSAKEIVETGLKRFQLIASAEAEQRRRELEDLLFDRALPEDQWPSDIWSDRQGGVDEWGRTTSSRPCLVIPKLDQPVMQVINEIVAANLGVRVTAKSGAGKKDAEVRQGLIRCVEQDSMASTAYDWGANRMAKCGRGFWRVNKKYANDGDFEMDLTVDRVLDQGSVFCDPFSTQATWADMEYAFVTKDLPEEQYLRLYKDKETLHKTVVNDPGALQAVLNAGPGWVGGTSGARVYRVAEYFYAVYETKTRLSRPGPQGRLLAWLEDLPPAEQELAKAQVKAGLVKSRQVDKRSIKWVVMNAYEVLDEEVWEGRYIPVVPCIGKEYMIDGKRVYKGIVSNAKDAQRSYNYMRSAQVEAVGLAPRAPWVVAEGQDEGYEQMWRDANVRNFPYLIYKPTSLEGQPVAPPQRNVAEPAIQAVTLAVREADADIKATTGRYDPSLGQVKGDQSGKAIQELKQQGENTTSNYTNSVALAITYTGMVVNDMLEHVYNTEGRVARILGDEDVERPVLFKQPFVERNGEAVPVPEGTPDAQYYDLSKGEYLVRVSAGKSFATQQEETARVLEVIFQAAPQLVPLGADIWVESLGSPAARRLAERLRKANPQLAQEEAPELRDLPESAKAMISQLQEKNQALEAQHGQLVEALQKETDLVKGRKIEAQAAEQGKVAQKQLELKAQLRQELVKQAGDTQRTIIESQVKLAIEMARMQSEDERARAEQQMQRLSQMLDLAHERAMAAIQAQADERSQARDHAHEMAGRAVDGVAARLGELDEMQEEGSDGSAGAPPASAAEFAAPPAPGPGASLGV